MYDILLTQALLSAYLLYTIVGENIKINKSTVAYVQEIYILVGEDKHSINKCNN